MSLTFFVPYSSVSDGLIAIDVLLEQPSLLLQAAEHALFWNDFAFCFPTCNAVNSGRIINKKSSTLRASKCHFVAQAEQS
jgi:hypothetical protein